MAYSINPVSCGLNNFFEGLTNSSNPTYIQPISNTPTYNPPTQTYTPSPQVAIPPPMQSTTYPLPTVTYTPESLRSSYTPLSSNYIDSYYGR